MSDRKTTNTADEKVKNGAREEAMKQFQDLYSEPPPYSPASGSTFSNGSQSAPRNLPSIEQLNFQPSPLEIPTPAECIAHLKLLHAFAKLRHDVGNHEGLYGIYMADAKENVECQSTSEQAQSHGVSHATNGHDNTVFSTELDPSLAERVRDKRWLIFVNKAVARFEQWWQTMPQKSSQWDAGDICETDFDTSTYGIVVSFPISGEGWEARNDFRLPPLDVLMVWHAHMLNPRIYLEDAIRYTRHRLWRTEFPWQEVYAAIDNRTFEYRPSDVRAFWKQTDRPWDALKDEQLKRIACPKCSAAIRVPWTNPPTSLTRGTLDSYLISDTGYTGEHMQVWCTSCNFTITHEKLRVGKFVIDAEAVLDRGRPLCGTMLSTWGEPTATATGKNLGSHDYFFPQRVVKTQYTMQPLGLRDDMGSLTVEELKNRFGRIMYNSSRLAEVNKEQSKPTLLAKMSKVAVRKVLSHYWDNSSMFGIDLVGAVLRQGSFVQKMAKLDWLHSPALMTTVQRLIVKYHRFVRLAADNVGRTVVPTLDVDLAWHTHQMTPKMYYRYTLAEVKKFLNHDDKIPETSLHTAFQFTSQAYERKYGQPYSECSCWYCECTREPLRSNFLSKLSSRRSSLSLPKLDEKGFTKDAHSGPHISAHNALPFNDPRNAAQRRRELEELDLQYAKVLKRYQKSKHSDPPRKDDKDAAFIYGAYGYPMYYPMPVYVPYYADPSCANQPSDKGSGGGGSGSASGCVAGTCAPGVSLGSCAGGAGTPGCQASCGGHGNADGGCGTCASGGDSGGGCGGGCGGGGD